MGRSKDRIEQTADGAIPVVQYVRMSTDHQRYSTENQCDAIQRYATEHGMVILRTYADEGRSGLNLEGRDALKRLIQEVQAKRPDFKAILVYDISRWGRFQDADESAYYEYLCRRAGIQVIYCAEPFANDGSPMATMMKSMKRVMAGEYSRELSTKVFMGQCRLIELGFRQGGNPGYGLRRLLLDDRHQVKGQLRPGERKSLQTDRVILTPGPTDEVDIVRHIYDAFVRRKRSEQGIADELNARKIATDQGRPWTRGTVHQVLINEKYVGNNVYNRTSFKLKQKRVRNPRQMWIRAEHAFEPVVSTALFTQANALIAERSQRIDDATMLDLLQQLYSQNGVLSGLLIDEQEDMPSSSAYRLRFNGLVRAYSLVGFEPRRDYHYLEINRQLRAQLPDIIASAVAGFVEAGGRVRQDEETGLLTVNEEFTVSITLARCLRTPAGAFRWRIRFDTSLRPDVTVAIRMAADQQQALDYYLFPRIDLPLRALRLNEERNGIGLDAYRFETLDPLYALAERVPFKRAA